ncbi:hypothetical protein [Bacillus sp. UMB0728]|uniref:hypothetical protein n=1 Tax=Bacillus sp. UMB0728 TaxID=2066052 RepID=UPI000C7614A3|nr:hypothetical protein [Bacillus sp. UMB0728]PLR70580.1 hypothetical protein CYJ37_23920 [Bacillus sp. UMB0728]
MIQIHNLNIDFTNIDITPFFQVKDENRVRFGLEIFETQGTELLKNLIMDILPADSSVSSSFISGYLYKNKRTSLKTGLGRILKISNWKETEVSDNEKTTIFGTVNGLRPEHIFEYTKMIINGLPQSYIIFYNDQTLIYVSSDVIDIISEVDLINSLKSKYNNIYEKGYEG